MLINFLNFELNIWHGNKTMPFLVKALKKLVNHFVAEITCDYNGLMVGWQNFYQLLMNSKPFCKKDINQGFSNIFSNPCP